MCYLTIIFFIFMAPVSFSGVNLKNGNFYVSYTDVIASGEGKSIEITRTYNSKSSEIGWFGIGWGSRFETDLQVNPDGTIIIHENGSGALTRFSSDKKGSVQREVAKIIAQINKNESLLGKDIKNMQDKLLKDADLRYHYVKKFGLSGEVRDGTKLYSNQRGYHSLTKIKEGYVRVLSDGTRELFNQHGKLATISYGSGYVVQLLPKDRKKDKELVSIKDSSGKQIFLKWFSNGLIKSIDVAGTKRGASYVYRGKVLASSIDLKGNKYTYKFDKNYNLIKVGYKDKKSMMVSYDLKTQLTSSVTNKEGVKTEYEYGFNPKKPDLHYWTQVKRPGFNGKPVINRYEYEIKVKPDGQRYTYRIETIVNNLKTETVYSKLCGSPMKISRGDKVTIFSYNKECLLSKKTFSNGRSVELQYDKSCRKVSRVKRGKEWTNFGYDKRCNLTDVMDFKGRKIVLLNNHKSQITKMINYNAKTKKKSVLIFSYNASGKPVEIEMDKVGKINVKYGRLSKIKDIRSEQGHKVALEITKAFQSLLAVVKPAGVSLGFR